MGKTRCQRPWRIDWFMTIWLLKEEPKEIEFLKLRKRSEVPPSFSVALFIWWWLWRWSSNKYYQWMPTKPSVDARQQRHHWPKDYASCIAFQGRITPKALHSCFLLLGLDRKQCFFLASRYASERVIATDGSVVQTGLLLCLSFSRSSFLVEKPMAMCNLLTQNVHPIAIYHKKAKWALTACSLHLNIVSEQSNFLATTSQKTQS